MIDTIATILENAGLSYVDAWRTAKEVVSALAVPRPVQHKVLSYPEHG